MGKFSMVNNHERRPPAEFQEIGAPPQGQGDRWKAPRPPLGDSFGACALSAGLEFQEDSGGTVLGVVDPKSWTDFRPSLESVPAVSLSLCHFSSNSSGVR